ncbi:hypothetical protein [Desulforegula conservatrix]|uniref:hypothetical protein n=1 Tax=Desulforegula conservatrix TaxID=153026 RepID=UPI00054E5866|nr:hypothetical protein [Desulforegula conservatrix]
MPCYCQERLNNPKVAELMKDIPEGFCGLCDICDRPGHTRAHPNLPTSGAWCDEHWKELLARPSITIDSILKTIIIAISFVMIALAIYRLI